MVNRLIHPLKTNSFFLFGSRGTGKSYFLKDYFKADKTLWIDLLNPELEDEYQRKPETLKQQIQAQKKKIDWVIIDEVQKVPKLLNIVHQSIENTSLKFALTGSSARKLKRGSANLLAGRAFVYHLFPLTHWELLKKFDLDAVLNWGALPKMLQFKSEEEKNTFLRSYALTYLKEEIVSEQVIRQLEPFRRFLEVSAQLNGEILNYSNIARDVGVSVKTVQSYYQILEDTLLGYFLPAFHQSVRKQQRQAPKFFFFDLGIKKALDLSLQSSIKPNTYAYGKAFEHFLILEIYRLNNYLQRDFQLYYLQTKDNAEIDLIIQKPGRKYALIEIKSTTSVDERDVRTLNRFRGDFSKAEVLCLSQDEKEKEIDGVLCLPWREGIKRVFEK
ncbi:MAG: ATP-binding protein [Deltaproteobacteria bacterium]|nr:ATP-binding protein [Deltaproteobacteria bacterium]